MATAPPVAVEEAAAEDKEKVGMCNAADLPASAQLSEGDVVAAADASTQPTDNLLQDPPRTCLNPLGISLILIIFQYPPYAANLIDIDNVRAVTSFVGPPTHHTIG